MPVAKHWNKAMNKIDNFCFTCYSGSNSFLIFVLCFKICNMFVCFELLKSDQKMDYSTSD